MGELRVVGRRRGGEDVLVGASGSGDDSASESMAASFDSGASSGSLCSSIMSSLTDDDAESSPVACDPASSSPSDTMQLDVDGAGPLYELSSLLAHLPVRTGLSKYYKGRSQSFASLSDAKCLQDLAKETTTTRISRKASRSLISRHVPGPCSKTIAKKTAPRGSSGRMPSRARSRGLPHRSGKPPAYQSKKELCSGDFC